MEKEKILRQLEEKLLPSVQNLEKGLPSEHDFFPALLWILLEKIKDSENQLQKTESSNREGLKQAVNFIVTKNQSFQAETNQVIDKGVESLYNRLEGTLTQTENQIIDKNKTIQTETNQVIDNRIENLYTRLETALSQSENQIANKNKTIQTETNLILNKEIEKLYNQIEDLNTIQKSQNVKYSNSFKWVLGVCIFQFIVLTSLIVAILMR